MKLNTFNKLYKNIILENSDIIIKYKTFEYKFTTLPNDNIECSFKSINKTTNKLISIKATVFENNTYEFMVIDESGKEKTYTDKEFLLAYYQEYQDFKHVLSEYKTKIDKKIQTDKQNISEKFEIQDGKQTEKIINFNDVLMQENDIKNGQLIKTNGISFTIKQVEDKIYKNLITISFEFQNNNPLKSEIDLLYYDVIVLAKITDISIKILNINLYDPDDLKSSTPIEIYTEAEFKKKFLTIYFVLKETLSKYFKQIKIENKF